MPLALNPLTPLELVSNLPNFVRGAKADSLLDYTAATRVEPICIVDSTLWNQPYAADIMQSALTLFSSLYLSAVGLSTPINGVSVSRKLEQFNPKRDPINGLTDTIARLVSVEQYQFGLPKMSRVASEGFAIDKLIDGRGGKNSAKVNGQAVLETGAQISKDSLQVLRENSNLSVGKTLTVDFSAGGESATAMVTVRLNTIPAGGEAIKNILCAGAEDRSLKERKYAVKAGQLRFWQDLVGCADLLDKRRKAILNDPTGLYMQSIRDQRKNALTGWLTGKPSVASASNIVVISQATAVLIERELTIRLENAKERARLFQKSAMMVLYVVDDEFEQVEVYYRNIDNPTKMSIANMKNANKGSSDIKSLVDLMAQNKAPTF